MVITRCGQRAFKITGLTWLGRSRRFSKDYEYRVQTSDTMIDVAAIRLLLNRLAPAWRFSDRLSIRAAPHVG